ncbi:MAG TPA: hypothetical protein VGQ19_16665 [Burkholderiales bacterium]|nr:hypothetical protein [Burkholderiales bacterium]
MSPVLFVKESFWLAEFPPASLAHEYNKITMMTMIGSDIRNLPVDASNAVAQSPSHRDNPG